MSQTSDAINLFKHLTLYRVVNTIGLKLSYWLSRITKRPFQLGLPFNLSIGPTTACNLGCPECPSGLKQFTRPTGKIDLIFHEGPNAYDWLRKLHIESHQKSIEPL
jgi:hypothetical protein